MSKFLELKQRRSDLNARLDAIAEALEKEGRAMTPEEKTERDSIMAELPGINEAIALIEQRQAADRSAPGADIVVGRDLREGAPWGPAIPANASVAEKTRLTEIGLGNMLQAVANASTPGGKVDPRLVSAAASGQNTGTPSDGGFLVKTDYSTFLLDRGREAAVLAPLCDNIPIGSDADGLEAPMIDETSRATGSRWGGVQVYRRAETDTVTATKVKFAAWDLRLEDLMALSYASERSLRDASSLGSVMSDAFASEFAFVIDDEIFRGDGNGRCQGVLNANALVSVAKETGQQAATVLSTNLSNMWARLPVRNRANARWFINQEVEPMLDELSIPSGTGALDSKIVTYGPDGVLRIKGRPVTVLEQASALGTQGDVMVADMNEYALISKDGIDAQESIHVRFLYAERAFRWVYRINGQPKWSAALTPYKGTSGKKLSPFVMLDTRA